jgi:ATP phosphoribosyltransferase
MNTTLTIALSKGRILKQTLPLLNGIGITISDDELSSRKLILDTNHQHIKVIVLRPTDVPVFVQHGAADIGVAGKDSLLEHGGNNIIEALDLKISQCKLMVAGRKNDENIMQKDILKVATKYVHSAQHYFDAIGKSYEIIKLYGAMELAPIVGMSDIIVDLVDTGNTLVANGLVPFEHICDISSRLIINNSANVVKNTEITTIVNNLKNQL